MYYLENSFVEKMKSAKKYFLMKKFKANFTRLRSLRDFMGKLCQELISYAEIIERRSNSPSALHENEAEIGKKNS